MLSRAMKHSGFDVGIVDVSVEHGPGVVLHVWELHDELVQLAVYVLGLLLVIVLVVLDDQGPAATSDLVVVSWVFVPVLGVLGSFQEVSHIIQ